MVRCLYLGRKQELWLPIRRILQKGGTSVEFHFLGLFLGLNYEQIVYSAPDLAVEDLFCMQVRKLGTKGWPSMAYFVETQFPDIGRS